jgi:trimeric autotransporter adhesin
MPSGSKDQIIGGGTPTDLPATIGRLPVYTIGGLTAHISDSVFAQADAGHQVIIGAGAAVNAGQVAGAPATIIGENASGWGDGVVAIGRNAAAGQTAAKSGAIAIGYGAVTNGINAIRIGSAQAFGDDWIAIGTQASAGGLGTSGIAIGRSASAGRQDTIAIGTTAVTGLNFAIAIGAGSNSSGTESICIGRNAAVIGSANIAIGSNSQSSVAGGGGSIAIGVGSTANFVNAIAIGGGATAQANSVQFGSTASPIHDVTAASLNTIGGAMALFEFYRPFADADGNVGLRLMTKKTGAIVFDQVTLGAADSGGVGFKVLRVAN